MSQKNRKIVITTGDLDGVGLEVTSKALHLLGPTPGVQFIYFRGPMASNRELRRIRTVFRVKTCFSLEEALLLNSKPDEIIEIISDSSPAHWVEPSGFAAKENKIAALVTGPLSKQEIMRSGLKDIGHTDILKRVCGCKSAYMGFLGKFFKVVLATGHLPVSEIEERLTTKTLRGAIKQAEFISLLTGKSNQKLGLLGLNPHSGDDGIIGDFEMKKLRPLVVKLQTEGYNLEGPLVPDTAFIRQNWARFSCYIALYHDQGLIPFKSFHGFDSGAHITLGLPLLRTSVDHGTAKNIFNRDKASPQSMLSAIKWSILLAKRKGN